MKYFKLFIGIIILVFSISCSNDQNHTPEPTAPESLSNVVITFEPDSSDSYNSYAYIKLELSSEGTAISTIRLTLCCWIVEYGNYTYDKETVNTGALHISVNLGEYYDTGQIISSQTLDRSDEYTLYFNTEKSGSYTYLFNGTISKGTFTISDME